MELSTSQLGQFWAQAPLILQIQLINVSRFPVLFSLNHAATRRLAFIAKLNFTSNFMNDIKIKCWR